MCRMALVLQLNEPNFTAKNIEAKFINKTTSKNKDKYASD